MRRALRPSPAAAVVALAFALVAPLDAAAADVAPATIRLHGATLRLVAEAPSAQGEIRAALLVDLEPGWKTYWVDPGDAGIPPRLDPAGSTNLVLAGAAFPLPHRSSDAYGVSNVYDQPIAVALILRRPDAGVPARITLGVTLGLCREICIPATARLGLDVAEAGAGAGAASEAETRLVAYAFEALPEASTQTVGIRSARLSADGSSVEVEALAPSDRPPSGADLFLAGPSGWYFGAPAAPRREGRRLVFTVPVAARPKAAGSNPLPHVEAVMALGGRAFRAEDLPVEAAR